MAQRRSNGLEKPYNTMQFVTWILLPLLTIQFLLCITAVFPLMYGLPVTFLFLICSYCSGYYGYKACITDPIDPRLLRNHTEEKSGEESVEPETKYCWVCETRTGTKSMHCKFCNKCVENFDHHCQWLNTCVGKRNYGYFFNAVRSTCLFVMIHMTMSLVMISLYFSNIGKIKHDSDALYGINYPVNVYIVICFSMVSIISTLLVGQLWYFHVTLKREGLTTYEFIVKDNAKRRDKFKEKMALKRERIVATNKAKREGRQWDYYCLIIGGKLSPYEAYCCCTCDPLVKEKKEKEANKTQIEVSNILELGDLAENSQTSSTPPLVKVTPNQKLKPDNSLAVEKTNEFSLQNEARSETNDSLNLRSNDHSRERNDIHTESYAYSLSSSEKKNKLNSPRPLVSSSSFSHSKSHNEDDDISDNATMFTA